MSDTKHGWVTPRADGAMARCGGPGICATCTAEREHVALYELKHGLSQCPPGPLEPVELPHQDDTLARTGNTARDQEMYAAGLRDGEENAKHNAAIRAGVPAGYKLVPIEPTPKMIDATWDHSVDRDGGIESQNTRNRRIYAAMLAAAPAAPGVSTVEDERQAFEAWAKRKKMPLARIGQQYDDFWVDHAWNGWQARAALDAPAAGDALDAARLDWLQQHDGRFYNKDRISSIVGTGFLVAGDEKGVRHQTLRAAIDAAIAAQRKGDA